MLYTHIWFDNCNSLLLYQKYLKPEFKYEVSIKITD